MAQRYAKRGYNTNDYDQRREWERKSPVITDSGKPVTPWKPEMEKAISKNLWTPTSKDHSLKIKHKSNTYDFSVYNYSEKSEYEELDTTEPGNTIITNWTNPYEGWVPFGCDTMRIKQDPSWFHNLASTRYNYQPYTAISRPYFYFYPRREGVYQVTVELALEVDRVGILNDTWLTGLMLILAKSNYDVFSNANYIYGPIKRQLIADSSFVNTEAIENMVSYRVTKNTRLELAPTTLSGSIEAINASMNCVNKITLRGTTLVYMKSGDVLTAWHKNKSGFYADNGTTYLWNDNSSPETAIRATHLYEVFEANWQGFDYVEENWYNPIGLDIENIINRF